MSLQFNLADADTDFNQIQYKREFAMEIDKNKILLKRAAKQRRHAEDADTGEIIPEVRSEATLLKAGALQSAIFNSANFSSIATDAKGVIQIFNVGAERMLGYTAAEVMNKIKIGRAHV